MLGSFVVTRALFGFRVHGTRKVRFVYLHTVTDYRSLLEQSEIANAEYIDSFVILWCMVGNILLA